MASNVNLDDMENNIDAQRTESMKRGLSTGSEESPSPPAKKKVSILPLELDQKKIPGDSDNPSQWCKFLFEQLQIMNKNFENLAETADFACGQAADALKQNKLTNELMAGVSRSISNLVSDNVKLNDENKQLKEHILRLECQQRRENLIFEGFQERRGETDFDCYNRIAQSLCRMPDLDPFDVKISRCHRIGPYIRGKTRAIVAHFHWFGDRQYILENRRYLPTGIRVREDFPEEIEDRRRVLRPILNLAKKNENYKNKVHLSVDKLIVNNRAFTYAPKNNLNELPEDLKPEKAAEREDETTLVFFGQNSHFSNFHPASISVEGEKFSCSEQYIQHAKAKLFNDDIAATRIKAASSPYRMKELGSRVRNFDKQKWSENAPQIARKVLWAKFSQHNHLKNRLLSTGDKVLAEATKERLWGCGVGLHETGCLHKQNWQCQGIMGEALVFIRQKLRESSND